MAVSIMVLEQQNEKVLQERTLEDKINDPKTSWNELVKIRDQLTKETGDFTKQLKKIETDKQNIIKKAGSNQHSVMEAWDDPEMGKLDKQKNLLLRIQERINKEEPQELKNFRQEEEKLYKEIQNKEDSPFMTEINDTKTGIGRLQEIKKTLEQQKIDYTRQSQDLTSGRVQNKEDTTPAPAYVQQAIEMLPKIKKSLDAVNARLEKKE